MDMNADKFVRAMRLLTSVDIFAEVKDRCLHLTSVGKQLYFIQYVNLSISHQDFC